MKCSRESVYTGWCFLTGRDEETNFPCDALFPYPIKWSLEVYQIYLEAEHRLAMNKQSAEGSYYARIKL